ncbi:hypothetical protein PUN28_002146 [Cardiocondyla obscurior]|uniref:Uncharacterized protein n=1 Tax=Cardiocondyla obscurior TaxID=286306 RepID=A0AAW2GST4_9HYME
MYRRKRCPGLANVTIMSLYLSQKAEKLFNGMSDCEEGGSELSKEREGKGETWAETDLSENPPPPSGFCKFFGMHQIKSRYKCK